tara:strand:+ start:27 stop:602 length:576 start_codon:yes stop_codon:yes gene_type:complete
MIGEIGSFKMKKLLLLILLCLPLIGFGQDAISFSTDFPASKQSIEFQLMTHGIERKIHYVIYESNPPSNTDGRKERVGSIVLSDTLVKINIGRAKWNGLLRRKEYRCYIYDITNEYKYTAVYLDGSEYNMTKVSFKLKEKYPVPENPEEEYYQTFSYIDTGINGNTPSVFVIESINESSNRSTKRTYILKQ